MPISNRTPLVVGTLLNARYRILKRLGGGGFGITYEAQDTRLGSSVALKELFPMACNRLANDRIEASAEGKGMRDDPDAMTPASFERFKERSRDEGERLKNLDHPGIVPVYEVFEANNTVYIVMKLLTGQTLMEYMEGEGDDYRQLSWREAVALIQQLEAPLTYLHQRSILHRDIKPGNLMRQPDGTLVLIDFGGAREFFAYSQSYTRIFSKGFSSPEQYKGNFKATPAVDVYGTAATLYFLLTGNVPPLSLSRLGDEDDLRSPGEIQPQVPKVVSDAVMRGMAPRAAERTPTMAAFIQSLRHGAQAPTPRQPHPEQFVPLSSASHSTPERPADLSWLWGVAAIAGLFVLGFTLLRPFLSASTRTGSSTARSTMSIPAVNRNAQASAEKQLAPGKAGAPQVQFDPAPSATVVASSTEIQEELEEALREGRDTKYCKCRPCKCETCECTPSNARDSED